MGMSLLVVHGTPHAHHASQENGMRCSSEQLGAQERAQYPIPHDAPPAKSWIGKLQIMKNGSKIAKY